MQFSFPLNDITDQDASFAMLRLSSAIEELRADGYVLTEPTDLIEIARDDTDQPTRIDVTFRIDALGDIRHVRDTLEASVSALRDNGLMGLAY